MASELFDLNAVKNHPRRSGFDLSSHRPFSAKLGELLPCYVTLCYPDDEFELPHEHFTRTQPVNTAAFARTREYFDWYFVPLRLINKNLPQAFVQMQNNPVQASSIISSKQITTDIPHASLFEVSQILGTLYRNGLEDNSQAPALNIFGFQIAGTSIKLLQYLGYGNILNPRSAVSIANDYGYTSDLSYDLRYNVVLNLNVQLLYPLAYQKIYSDYYRYSQWERNEPFTYNVDYYSGGSLLSSIINGTTEEKQQFAQSNNLFTLRYANWPKDMYMGVLPDSQLGEIATVSIDGSRTPSIETVRFDPDDSAGVFSVRASREVGSQGLNLASPDLPSSGTFQGPLKVAVPGISSANFNILQLRMAEALQRFREIAQCADQTFLGQLEAIWNVKLPSMLSDRCVWIGGSASNLDISSVENQNLSDSDVLIKGKGIGSSTGSEKFSCKEPGVLMCIYHALPFLDHTVTGQTPDLLYTNTADFPNPVFDKIGMQSIPICSYINNPSFTLPDANLANFPMGYLPRYFEAKTNVDRVFGAFCTTLKDWTITLSPEYLSKTFPSMVTNGVIDYRFFKVNPAIADNIFAVKVDSTVDTDQLLVNFYAGVKVVRSLDYDGMPY